MLPRRMLMTAYRKEPSSGKALLGPLLGAAVLVAFYLVLSEWQDLPNIINVAVASVRWPN
jgi:hypothetical protein